MSTSVGRNDPCPCGSGKKYKKCCLARDRQAAAVRASEAASRRAAAGAGGHAHWGVPPEEDDLDELSNSIVDLIREGDLDAAERRCHELRERHPQVPDWMMRLGAVHEARGERSQAAAYYRQVADFAEQEGGYDDEFIESFRQQAETLDSSNPRVDG